MTPDQREMYRMAGVNRAADIAGRWNITRQLLIVHPLLLAAVTAQLQTGRTFLPNMILAFAGLTAGVIGYFLLRRVGNWIDLWTDDAKALEEKADDSSARVFGGRYYESMRRTFFCSGLIILGSSFLVILMWLGFLIAFVLK